MNDEPTFDPRRKDAIRDLIVTTARTSAPRQGRKRTALVVALVVLALGISGGGVAYALGNGFFEPHPVLSPTPTPTTTPISPPTFTVTPAPTPTPAAPTTDPTDPSTWTIGFDGVGPVVLGSPLEAQRQTLPAFSDITDPLCVASHLSLQAPSGLSILFVGAANGSDTTAAITLGNFGAPQSDPRGVSPKTAEGIGVGATLQELLAAYPDIQKTGTYGEATSYYGLTNGQGAWIVFRVTGDVVNAIQIANEAVMPAENGSVKTMPSERCPA